CARDFTIVIAAQGSFDYW
nr:immunoglobulin heavy chain junction region [Macaca mulatta]